MPITINQTSIHRLSGPVSTFLLRPNPSWVKRMAAHNLNAPIYWLFGDRHESTTEQCELCQCDASSCCLSVVDTPFLKQLDGIAKKRYPVDFYTERFLHQYSTSKLIKISKDRRERSWGQAINSISGYIAPCYDKKQRGTLLYQQLCPTKRVRWQSADPKQSEMTHYPLESFLHNWFELMKTITQSPQTSFTFLKQFTQRYPVSQILELLPLAYLTGEPPFMKQLLHSELRSKSFGLKQLDKIEDDKWKSNQDHHLRTYYRFLYGQYRSGKDPKQVQAILRWKRTILQIIHEALEQNTSQGYQLMTESLKMVLDGFSLIEKRHLGKSINDLCANHLSIFVDLYFIGRTIKPPEQGITPMLALAFLGNKHIEHLVYFWTKIAKEYTIVVSHPIESNPKLRCLSFQDDHVSIDEIIDKQRKEAIFAFTPVIRSATKSTPT